MQASPATFIKICGLTRPEDVAQACRLGVDAVGYVLHPASPRYRRPEQLAELEAARDPRVQPVLLVVKPDEAELSRALDAVPRAIVQFHGEQTPAQCRALGRPYWRAIAMSEGTDLLEFALRFSDARALLLDGAPPGQGGLGQRFDWALLPARPLRRVPLILAGGLDPANVGQAIARARPDGVDVSSGVEDAPGIKGAARMREFVQAVRRADLQSHPAGQGAGAA
jgi:phosphoribosylanthranilate isomerase